VADESKAIVHGYAVASAWAAGILVTAAVLAAVLINAHPGRARAEAATRAETALAAS
jgi:hypothetical protein